MAFLCLHLTKKVSQCMHVFSVTSDVSDCLWPHGLSPARLLCPWDSPGKNTGVGCHASLQGIFPPRDQAHVSRGREVDSALLSHWGSPQ